MNEAGSACIEARVLARPLLALVLLGCGSAPPPEHASLSRMPPQGFVRVDLERTPARDACDAAQRRLDTKPARDAYTSRAATSSGPFASASACRARTRS